MRHLIQANQGAVLTDFRHPIDTPAPQAAEPEEDEMDMDKPPVDPTPEEWENVVIPGLRRYLQSENHALYEIDVRRSLF